MKLSLGFLNTYLRLFERPALRLFTAPKWARARFRLNARLGFKTPPSTLVYQREIGAVPGLWVQHATAGKGGLLLYFHGGGYTIGAPQTHSALVATLSRLSGLPAFLPDYRKAPEHPFPAAPRDALSVYQALLDLGYPARKIALGGDSAGGGLALSLLQKILKSDLAPPGRTFVFSPWTDLSGSGASIRINARSEAVLPPQMLQGVAASYLGGADPMDPDASPLFADFNGAPPILIQVGTTEILRDDSRRIATRLQEQGVAVTLTEYENHPHVWQLFHGFLPEADQALQAVADFIAGPPPES